MNTTGASRPVFRVAFDGPLLESEAWVEAFEGADGRWEGSKTEPGPEADHRVLVGAYSEAEAIGIVRAAMAPYGTVTSVRVTPVTDARGQVKRTPIRRWEDIDWEDVESKNPLTELERALIDTLLDAAEPTWIILKSLDVPDDLQRVEATLRGLEDRGLVYSTWEPAAGPDDFGVLEDWRGRRYRMCYWWALSDEGWDLLGLIKSPSYH